MRRCRDAEPCGWKSTTIVVPPFDLTQSRYLALGVGCWVLRPVLDIIPCCSGWRASGYFFLCGKI